METKELIALITAIVLEVVKQMGSNTCNCGQNCNSQTNEEKSAGSPIATGSRREVFTLDDIKDIHKAKHAIIIKRGDVLTSLAADYIKDKKLEIRYEIE